MFYPIGSKATVCAFTRAPGIIVTGHESGKVSLFDVRSGEEILNKERAHMDTVTDLQMSLDQTYFITSSRDKTARVSWPEFCLSTAFVDEGTSHACVFL
jgi:translation initiation factor 3 subunit I